MTRHRPVATFVAAAAAASVLLIIRPAAAANAATPPAYTAVVLDRPAGFDHAYGMATGGGRHVGHAHTPGYATTHAVLWTHPAAPPVDLHPAGFTFTQATGTDGARQVGYGGSAAAGQVHAMAWSGTAGSAVDIHPAGYTASFASAVRSNQAVGFAADPSAFDRSRAVAWDLASGETTNLHPAHGFAMSWAHATDGTRQAGYGEVEGDPGHDHALLWSGTAASVVDLHPSQAAGPGSSRAYGIHGDQVVGQVAGIAALWDGPGHTFVSLGSPGGPHGSAQATNGTHQVGWLGAHASRWSGSADSVLDLHQFLPAGYAGSRASAIDADGVILGTASTPTGTVAVLWVPAVPEPAAASAVVALAAARPALRRRPRRPRA